MRGTKSSALLMAVLLAITIGIASSTSMPTSDQEILKSPDTTIEEWVVLVDPSMNLDISKGRDRRYWLTNREASFSINPKVFRQLGSGVRVTAGIDPCGRQTVLEVSATGGSTVILGTKTTQIYYDSVKTRIHVRSLGPVCLIGSDPRNFYGRVEVSINVDPAEFRFDQK